MNPIEQNIVDAFKMLLSRKLKVSELILFGSRARGDADPDSDLDVLVIVDDLSPELEEYISDCAWEAGFPSGIVIVPVVYSRNEWENGPERYSLLAQAIKSEGVIL